MDEPRWLVDEMLGRLTRYLRFLGYDTEYVRGLTDDQIVDRARVEQRRVVTRDRLLSGRIPGSVLLTRTDIAGQMRELKAAFPELRHDVRFDRCSVCNGGLALVRTIPARVADSSELPANVREGQVPLYECAECGHFYWEGSHTASVRARMSRWSASEPGAE
jgi:uncharacterized protein